MMKTKLIISILLIFSVLSCSQHKKIDYESEIKKSFTAFFENIKLRDIDNAVSFVYPKYLDLITRDRMIEILNFSYNNPSLMIEIQDFKINTIEKPELINEEYFSITDYSFKMKFKANWNLIPNAELGKQKIHNAIITKYGKDNVEYFDNGDYYLIHGNMKACAISKDGKDWTFLILDEKYRGELGNVLPEKILRKI